MVDQRPILLVAVAAVCAPAMADDEIEEPVTDMEFLEYLGSWEESDEEWQLLEEAVVARSEEAPRDESEKEAPEANDES